jgi:hypothetical protein
MTDRCVLFRAIFFLMSDWFLLVVATLLFKCITGAIRTMLALSFVCMFYATQVENSEQEVREGVQAWSGAQAQVLERDRNIRGAACATDSPRRLSA